MDAIFDIPEEVMQDIQKHGLEYNMGEVDSDLDSESLEWEAEAGV